MRSINKTRYIALSLISVPVIHNLFVFVLGTCLNKEAMTGLTDEIKSVNYLVTFATPLAFLLLSTITTEKATRNTIKATAVIYLFLAFWQIVSDIVKEQFCISNIVASLLPVLKYIIQVIMIGYLFGVMNRNNKEAMVSRWINIYFIAIFIVSPMMINLLIHINGFTPKAIQTIYIIIDIMSVIILYKIITSDIFKGRSKTEVPVANWAYRFWNKYYLWFAIAFTLNVIAELIIETI